MKTLIKISFAVLLLLSLSLFGLGCGGNSGDAVNLLLTNDDSDTAVSIEVNTSANGSIQGFGETDWYRFAAVAGTLYTIETTLITLPNSKLFLYGKDGATSLEYDDDSGAGKASKIVWRCPSSGNYYAIVAGAGNDSGTYTISVTGGGGGGDEDDHGDTPQTATPVIIGSTVDGEIETGTDVDWFSFNAVAGTNYDITCLLYSIPTQEGYYAFYDKDGTTQLDGTSPWRCPSSGTYYIKFFTTGGATGTYTVSVDVSDSGPTDDHGDTPQTATHISVGSTVNGNIEIGGDLDWFSFYGIAGINYTITPLEVTLEGLYGLYDRDGVTLLDDYPSWQCNVSGTYYVEILGENETDTGTYTLLVTGN